MEMKLNKSVLINCYRRKIRRKTEFQGTHDDLCENVSQQIGVLNKIKRNLPINERKLY